MSRSSFPHVMAAVAIAALLIFSVVLTFKTSVCEAIHPGQSCTIVAVPVQEDKP